MLAVIVVLAIILLIVIPIVLNVIGDARKGAFESSAMGLIKTAENACMSYNLRHDPIARETLFDEEGMSGYELNFTGKPPVGGYVYINEQCEIQLAVHNNEWCAIKDYDELEVTLIPYDGNCGLIPGGPAGNAWTFEVTIPEGASNNNFKFGMNNPNLTIDWDDGTLETIIENDNIFLEHIYDEAGIYYVTLDGTANQVSFWKLGERNNWYAQSGNYNHSNCNEKTTPERLTDIVTPIPATFGLITAAGMFKDVQVESFSAEDFFDYAIGNVTSTAHMFGMSTSSFWLPSPSVFNQDISGWDTSNVETMFAMFRDATSFNQDIGGWDTGNVTGMVAMFRNATSFNQDLSNWCVSNISSSPNFFDTNTPAWFPKVGRQPIWGSCP